MANWSPDRQQAVQARCDKALKGPWTSSDRPGTNDVTIGDSGNQLIAVVKPCPNMDLRPFIAVSRVNADFIAHARQDLPDALAEIVRQQADLTRLAEVGKADRDRAERLLSALDWAGDISEWNSDGSWTARKDWRTVILDALFPTDAEEAARE